MNGYLQLVLHHHLPYIRHPEHPFFMEERWLFEAITETYLPLIEAWRALERDNVPFCFTTSMTPPLCNMLRDDLLMSRYRTHLQQLGDLCDKELARTQNDAALHTLARFYADRITRFAKLFADLNGDIVGEYKRLQDAGKLEIITCTATHGFLPLMNQDRHAMWAQVEQAARDYERHFERRPQGIWLAECGYLPRVDELLKDAGIRYFFVDTHAILHASAPPVYGVYAPLHCPGTGVAAFARDPESSKQVWSSHEGYPGDFEYREYYRDIGFDLDFDYISPYIHPDGIRMNTGLKYHRITGNTDFKDLYDPARARRRADEHAANFMFNRQAQIKHLGQHMDRPPVVVSPYDAELFGHWWFEGPWFLESLCRHLHHDQSEIALTTPLRVLEAQPVNQAAWPGNSSWGGGGYADFWCNETNEWVYRYLHQAASRMHVLADRFRDADGVMERALNQCARELMLAQSSDWAFIMKTGTTVEYAVKRTRDHLATFNQIHDQIWAQAESRGEIDQSALAAREDQWRIFPNVDFRLYG